MKKIFTLLLICSLPAAFKANAQIFWTENFESGSTAGLVASSYTGPNGAWTITVTGTEGASNNQWYVSCAENGHTTGGCGTGCAPVTTSATLATLHVGSTILGDMGASYYAGPAPNASTDRRANSPTIVCTGKYGISVSFYYTEDGDGTNDDATLWYSADNGTTWMQLSNPPKTPPICPGGQGYWDHYTIALPVTASNNPNVKLGFRWVNNNDGVGTDPSFAVDSVSLTTSSAVVPVSSFTVTPSYTVCQDSCLLLKNTSTGPIDSIKWTTTGGTVANVHGDTSSICFTTPGTYTITLTAYRSGVPHASTHTVTVNPTPHPVITRVGAVLSVTGTYSAYQWVNGITPIAGATNSSYTYSTPGTYHVGVDSGGCWGYATYVVPPSGIQNVNSTDNKFWIAQPSVNTINLYASDLLNEAVTINVYDPTGRQIIADAWEQGNNYRQLSCADCAPGLYIIRLSGKNTSAVLKWQK